MASGEPSIESLSHAEACNVLTKLKSVSPALSRLVLDAVASEIAQRTQVQAEAPVLGKDKARPWPVAVMNWTPCARAASRWKAS